MSATADDLRHMRHAIEACRRGIEAGQTPFGAALVRSGELLVATHNHVWAEVDATAHAEVVAIRQACRKVDEVHLAGATLYSTTEPCPMCFAAAHWARVERIVYGASIADAAHFGFNELAVSNRRLKELGELSVELVGGCLAEECVDLFRQWSRRPEHQAY